MSVPVYRRVTGSANQINPPIVSIQGSPRLRRDLLCFGSTFGEPVTRPHVGHSWRLALAFGSIGGDALRCWPSTGI